MGNSSKNNNNRIILRDIKKVDTKQRIIIKKEMLKALGIDINEKEDSYVSVTLYDGKIIITKRKTYGRV